MRVTNRMLGAAVLSNISSNLERLMRLQNQMSCGKVINRPSDNPMVLSRVMSLKASLAEQEQYRRNMEDATGFLEACESCVGTFTDTLQRVRQLAVYGASDTLSSADREAMAEEIDAIIDELVQTGNTVYGNQYIFSGQATTTPPLERFTYFVDANGDGVVDPASERFEGVRYNGDGNRLVWEMAPGSTMVVGMPGGGQPTPGFGVFRTEQVGVYLPDAAGNPLPAPEQVYRSQLFDALFTVRDALTRGDTGALDAMLGSLDGYIDHTLQLRAQYGAKTNRLSLALDRNFDGKIKNTELLSRLEDVDMAKIAMEYSIQEYVYQAALAVGAKVIQPSLVNLLG